jgi:hypothetical protein
LIGSISRLFEQPSIVSNKSSLGPFLEETVQSWNVSQGDGWLVDPVANRVAFGFHLLNSDNKEIDSISLTQLAEKIREASNASDAATNGLPTFDYYHGLAKRSVIVVNDVEGYESKAVMDKGTYLFAPSVWRILINGIGTEVRPFHEDTDWVRSAVQERSSRHWDVGTRLCPRFQASRIFGGLVFVRQLAQSFPDAHRVRLIADYEGLNGRTIDDPRTGIRFSRDRSSAVNHRRVEIDSTIEKLSGDGVLEISARLLNPILRLFDGWETNAEGVRQSLRDY